MSIGGNLGMMVAWDELVRSTGEFDRRGKGGATRTFKVVGVPMETILINPTSVIDPTKGPLPGYGTFHPVQALANTGMILDSYRPVLETKTTGNNNVLQVDALYSNDRRYAGPPHVDPTGNNGTRDARPQFERTVINNTIPYCFNEKIDVGLPSETERYARDVRIVEDIAYKTVLTLHFSNWNQGLADQVAAQNNTVHLIRGKWRLFESGDAIPVEDTGSLTNVYEITYSWVEDPGTPAIVGGQFSSDSQNPPAADDVIWPPVVWDLDTAGGVVAGEKYIRPPFHYVTMVFNQPNPFRSPIQLPPLFDVGTKFNFSANGWQNLPGSGRLNL